MATLKYHENLYNLNLFEDLFNDNGEINKQYFQLLLLD